MTKLYLRLTSTMITGPNLSNKFIHFVIDSSKKISNPIRKMNDSENE